MKAFKKFVAVYREILSVIGSCFFLTFCACVMIQIISRNFLPSAPSWTEELARYTFIYMVAFGSGVAILKDEFVFVEFLNDTLEAKGFHSVNKVIRLLVTIVMLVLSVYILFFSVPGFAFLKFQMVSTAMQIPMQYIYFSQVLMFSFLSLSCIFRILLMIAVSNKGLMTEEARLQAMKEEEGIA